MNSSGKSLYDDARCYDLIMGHYASGPLLDFYQRQAARFGDPILEMACGSGRLTIPLAQAGMNILGLDISEPMLMRAEHKAAERGVRVRFMPGDIRNFDLAERFNVIFIAAQSLSHLHSREDIEECFACVRRHLTSDGRFLVELHNPSITLLSRQPGHRYTVGEYEDQESHKRLLLTEEVYYDAAKQLSFIEWYIAEGEAPEEKVLSFEMRQYFPQEIDALLVYNGFTIEEKYGDYHEAVFSSTSPKQLIICRSS
jgi:SAM-dependent methyltransferase